HVASARTSCAAHVALAVVLGLLVAPSADTGTAIARGHHGGPAIARANDGNSAEIARAHGANTTAVAVNTTDGSLVFQLTFAILKVTGNVVDNQNVADAYASCTGCQTVAISIQTLLVEGVANVVAPIDEASARNQNCQQCDT